MSASSYQYVIVGGGLAGASAVEGIREVDPSGSILLVSAETDLPYQRPPLTKQLLTGGTTVEKTIVHDEAFYASHGVELRLGTMVTGIDPSTQTLTDSAGNTLKYQRLLLATGGTPRRLDIPGGNLDGLSYYRTLADYRALRPAAREGTSALVIGGGFIGSEIAASLRTNRLDVTMVFPSPWLVSKVFPESLGRHLTEVYRKKGVTIHDGDAPVSIGRDGEQFLVRTKNSRALKADLVVIGIGITLNLSLARAAGLRIDNGIVVNEKLQTSRPDIYAAGDVARFLMHGFGQRRLEHYDNALSQGKHAGRNMAGADEPFTYWPFFFSDLFDFGYEAVGDVDSRMNVIEQWQEPYKTGVLYYMDGDRLCGAMMCNVWDKVDEARQWIKKGTPPATPPQ